MHLTPKNIEIGATFVIFWPNWYRFGEVNDVNFLTLLSRGHKWACARLYKHVETTNPLQITYIGQRKHQNLKIEEINAHQTDLHVACV